MIASMTALSDRGGSLATWIAPQNAMLASIVLAALAIHGAIGLF